MQGNLHSLLYPTIESTLWELELSLIVVPALWNMLPITVRSIVLLLLLSITAH